MPLGVLSEDPRADEAPGENLGFPSPGSDRIRRRGRSVATRAKHSYLLMGVLQAVWCPACSARAPPALPPVADCASADRRLVVQSVSLRACPLTQAAGVRCTHTRGSGMTQWEVCPSCWRVLMSAGGAVIFAMSKKKRDYLGAARSLACRPPVLSSSFPLVLSLIGRRREEVC